MILACQAVLNFQCPNTDWPTVLFIKILDLFKSWGGAGGETVTSHLLFASAVTLLAEAEVRNQNFNPGLPHGKQEFTHCFRQSLLPPRVNINRSWSQDPTAE